MGLTSIKICSLEAVRETNLSIFYGVITMEDSTIENPFRLKHGSPEQLVLRFDDISGPHPKWIEPQEFHIEKALAFADKIGDGGLLIHCHAGISRSSAIALAIFAKDLGAGKEVETVKTLQKINPDARPNKLLVWMTDEILGRKMKLYNTAFDMMWLTN
tara:strand:+ start:60 stop:536 length:477 start_codon:yes stop_codon:yes gene_type:complete